MPKKKPISELGLDAIISIIVFLEIEREPEFGFTLSQLHKEISDCHPGSKDDLLKKLNALKARDPRCCMRGKYWGTPGNYPENR